METDQLSKEELTILQFIASQCSYFSKNNIVAAAILSGARNRSSEPYLLPFIQKGIIEPAGKMLNVSMYALNAKAWLEIIRSIQPDRYKWVVARGKNVGIYSHDYELAFAEAVHAFLHGLPYRDALARAVPTSYYGVDDSLMMATIDGLADERELWPLYYGMDEKLLARSILARGNKVNMLEYEQKDIDFLSAMIENNPNLTPAMAARIKDVVHFCHDLVTEGRLADMQGVSPASVFGQGQQAIACVQRAEYDAAVKLFAAALKAVGKNKYFMNVILNYYYAIALVGSRLSTARTKTNALLKERLLNMEVTVPMGVILMMEKGQKDRICIPDELWNDASLPAMALGALVCRHYHIGTDASFDPILDQVDRRGILLLQVELSGDFERYAGRREELARRTGMHPSLPPFVERPQWEVKLEELLRVNRVQEGASAPKAASAASQRIAYKVNVKYLDVQPVLQKSKDGINWSAGRNIAMEKFKAGQVEGMTPEDQKVASSVRTYSRGWYGGVSCELCGPKAVAALAGHPLVFDAETQKRLDVVEEKPVLTVSLEDGHYVVKCDIDVNEICEGCHAFLDGGGRMKVTKVPAGMKTTIATLSGLRFPPEAREKLTALLTVLSSGMIVMSDLLKSSDKVTARRAHPETVVRLQPMGEGIQCNLVVKPFATMPPLCRPGKGMQTITAMTTDGRHVQTTRNLDKERANYEAVTDQMVNYAYDEGTGTWTLAPEECLELLDTLRAMPSQCVIEWPEGERFRVSYDALRPADFSLSLGKASGWFELTGEVRISDKVKLKMADLMERLSQARGNFIQVGDKEYVRIAADLRRYIETLGRIASTSRGKMRISAFNVPQLEELGQSGMQMTADRAYLQLLQRVEKARTAEVKIPKTINADLRAYQKEGYLWMARLALWGAGALLADDMGLGKTVQAITLLLSRAKEGPQLVVVPTSLTLNWRSEMERFAPGLNALMLNRPGADRKTLVDGAKAYDVVITTYGLLVTEDALLASRQWTTVVLDEAHTIKNRDTKMSKAAMELKAEARLLLTGTPLQNHVSEVWNLMQFANPGLLGTFQEFTDRFILPIERDHDRERQRQLKRIITPFILRRTKTDVLGELPEKTEITLRVDLSEEEWAFYDNIRQCAVARLENGEATAMQALAEITRLRQAACNACLVQPDAGIPSSKLESLMQLVQDLHANHHRALVFSQFTSHLALVRRRLDQEGIQYLYLDGATPARERQRLTEEFQHGDVPLFLISLKAGGLGLNLTAANYVVHLDPWWNPAIEDQASDRAHRMGQKNPVTVYRLIAAGTIEEKILALHQTKKNMADALLEGGDVSATMSREEMMELIREFN